MATDEYGTQIPPVRPDAMDEDTEARPSNLFKQALNTFMYGSRDPSYKDVGEFRARGVFQHYAGEGMALSAIARPEVAGAIYQSYANQGAMAAQSMRERYYEKEHRQMIQAQIIPLKQEFDVVDSEYRNATQIVYMPIARTVTPEEAHARGVAMQATTPAPQEAVPAGKTADGKAKTKIVEGTAPPTPNAALGQQTMGAVEYTPESLAYIDPATGSPVPITSQRGQRIERDASDKLMAAHNRLVMGMMDAFAQYPGNPFAVESMQKIMDGMTNAAGRAVTGRADNYEQLKFFQQWKANEAKIQRDYAETNLVNTQEVGARTQANQLLRNYDTGVAGDVAMAASAARRAESDPEFLNELSPSVQANIRAGKHASQWNERDVLEAAQAGKLETTETLEDLNARRKAGMVHIEPKQINPQGLPNWHATLKKSAEYQDRLPVHYAQMKAKIKADMQSIGGMAAATDQEQAMLALGIPEGETELRNILRAGGWDDNAEKFLMNKVVNTQDYADAEIKAYMDALAVTLRDQPEVGRTMMEDNQAFIQEFVDQEKRLGSPDSQIQHDVELMQKDPMGTHIQRITGATAPGYRPYGYGGFGAQDQAPAAPQRGPSNITGGGGARPTAQTQPPQTEESIKAHMTIDNAFHIDAAHTGQAELGAAIEVLKDAQIANLRHGTGEKSREVGKRIADRLAELRDYHENPLEEAVSDFLTWRKSKRVEEEDRLNDLLAATEPKKEEPKPEVARTPEENRERIKTEQFGTFGQPAAPVSVTPEQAMTFDVSAMSQPQIKRSIDLLKAQQQEYMLKGDNSPKSVEHYRQLAARLNELNSNYNSWVEDLFRTDKIPQVN